MQVTITLEQLGTRTRMTLRQTGFAAIPERDGHRSGWTSCMGRLAEFLPAQI